MTEINWLEIAIAIPYPAAWMTWLTLYLIGGSLTMLGLSFRSAILYRNRAAKEGLVPLRLFWFAMLIAERIESHNSAHIWVGQTQHSLAI